MMEDLAVHRHEMVGATEDEVEHRMRNQYPNAVVILVRERERKPSRKEKQ